MHLKSRFSALELVTDDIIGRLRDISDWCNCNKLSMKPEKSEIMMVTNKILVNRLQKLIGADPIKEVSASITSVYMLTHGLSLMLRLII